MPNFISEDDIEQALVQRLVSPEFGYQTLNAYTEDRASLKDGSGRTDKRQVVLPDRLRAALERLNPDLPPEAIDQAFSALTQNRSAMSPVAANREVYRLIRDGVPIRFNNAQGREERTQAKVIDYSDPCANERLVVTQLWVAPSGQGRHWRRPDVLIYINGLPLVFIELKNSNVKLRSAFDKNLTDYRRDIPQLFVFNAILMLSNALETRVGSITGDFLRKSGHRLVSCTALQTPLVCCTRGLSVAVGCCRNRGIREWRFSALCRC